MVDETFDRLYREGSGDLNKGIDSCFRALGSEIRTAFRTLHRIKWDAPWSAADRRECN